MNDKKNAIKSLQTMLRSIKYPDVNLNLKELNDGGVKEHLKIYHYIFLSFSPALASEILNKHNLELNHKSDKCFVDGIYKLARDMLTYVPKLTKDQFFQTNFATQKCQMTIDLIKLVQQKCKSFQASERVILGGGGVGGGGGGGGTASANDNSSKMVTTSASMYSLNLKSNIQNGSTGGSSGNASSSSSSSISSYGNMAEQNDINQQNGLKPSFQVKNHLSMGPPLVQTGSVITSSRLGSNIRSTKSFNSKSLTRATSRRDENINPKTPPVPHSSAIQTNQPQNDSYHNIEQTINTLANSVKHLATVIGSFESRFVNIENSIASLTGSSINNQQVNTQAEPNASFLPDKTFIKKLDNLAAKITIIETDLMLLKQVPKQHSSNNNLSVNADDTASYETPFVSFSHPNTDNLNDSASNNNFMSAVTNSNRIVNLDQFMAAKSKLSSMSQGLLKENDAHHNDDLNYESNNDSMLSNDSTPKFTGNNKSNGFMQKFSSLGNESDAILRAKNLVLKAAKLNTEVKI